MRRLLLILFLAIAVTADDGNESNVLQTTAVIGGRILVWMPISSKSHYITFQPLFHELASRGHRLTVVKAIEDNDLCARDNVECALSGMQFGTTMESKDVFDGDPWKVWGAQEKTYNHPIVQDHIKKETKFDIVLLLPFPDVGLYLAHRVFKAPLFFLVPNMRMSNIDEAHGNSVNPAYQPNALLNYGAKMNFKERLINTLAGIAYKISQEYYFIPIIEDAARALLGIKESPNFMDILNNNAAFSLRINHVLFEDVYPVNPNSAMVAGLQTRPANPIKDKHIRKWLDEASNGAILVSFGSIITGSDLPVEKLNIFLDVFSKLDKRILWKWETEEMQGKPDNVMLKKWLPQQDILGHPNVELFITHAGFGSILESIYHETPVLSMPAFIDQFSNAARSCRLGHGQELAWYDLSVESLRSKLDELLSNSNYTARTKVLGSIFKDNLASPLDTAVYHVEYVMRHKGAPYLSPQYKNLYWFQFYLLDVMAFICAISLLPLYILCSCVKCSCRSKRKEKNE